MYIMYLMRRGRKIAIRAPNGIKVWIAVIKDDGTTFIPKEVDDPGFDESYVRVQHKTFDGLIDLAFATQTPMLYGRTKESFSELAAQALNEWTRPYERAKLEYGATCKRCNSYNEYAVSTNNFLCTSCKSYDEMYM